MHISPSANDLLEQRQLAGRAQVRLENREFLRRFALVLAVLVAAVAVATVLAGMFNNGATRL